MTPAKSNQPKTQKNSASVKAFVDSVENDTRRADAKVVLALMKRVTGKRPTMWGDSIVGFGEYTYEYASGRSGEWPMAGFSPRKQNMTLYIMSGFKRYATLLKKLGKHKTGSSCLYVNKLADIDLDVLEQLVAESFEHMKTVEKR
jgi:hypothetical protein